MSKAEVLSGVSHSESYTYDLQNRLQSALVDGGSCGWDYDANGNRLGTTTPTGTQTADYDAQDRLTRFGGMTFAYGSEGELRSKTDPASGITRYSYDVLGNLVSVTLPSGKLLGCVVDGRNRRVAKKVDGTVVRRWLFGDAIRPAAELDGNGDLVSEFVYASDTLVPDYLVRGARTLRIVSDQVSSPRLVVDVATGEVVERMRHDAWGNVLEDTNPGFIPFGFAGGIYDADSGLVRLGAGDYDPVVGRWTDKDPIRFGGGQTNLYAYVGNDPINRKDPEGKDDEEFGNLLKCAGAILECRLICPKFSEGTGCYACVVKAARDCNKPFGFPDAPPVSQTPTGALRPGL